MSPIDWRSAALLSNLRRKNRLVNLLGLLGSLIGGTLSSRSKSHRLTRHFLTGGRSSFLNTSAILGAAAVGFGAYEVWRSKTGGSTQNATIGANPIPTGPPPIPSVGAAPPPLPDFVAHSTDAVRRIAGLLVSAARADGELGEEEYARMMKEARAAGAEREILDELQKPRPLAEIVGDVRDPKLKEDLYVLAFAIVRADEDVNAQERAWLEELARVLTLDAWTVARLEDETAQRISRAS